ncbi:hypothetical protein Mettu_1070 [Methylobacter tundripaludum SV96]|uniref:Transposase IS701-like DDE domain-containing protein n=1 Tax=Methylobacter tundripaludum (strain ATCC BAA-1195 / DSM 17260 / SV96) TaxID=697282 RepID=G3IS95_METTV|nr:hypothetical protein Mettu_1070 [Methylobacter tundripaludum SV96]
MRGLFQSERANMLRMREVNEVDASSDALLGGSESVLIFDESAFAKKGTASAGVARQWNGRRTVRSVYSRPCAEARWLGNRWRRLCHRLKYQNPERCAPPLPGM